MTHTYTQVVEKSQGESQTRQPTHRAATPAAVSPQERYDRVAEAAYLRAEHRGFLPGCGASRLAGCRSRDRQAAHAGLLSLRLSSAHNLALLMRSRTNVTAYYG